MKFRSRVAAVAAAAGLAAGLLIVGGGGTAHAAVTFLDCDHVSGTGTIKPGLTLTPALQTISVGSQKIPTAGEYPRTCTGALAATTGPLVSQKGKLTGITSCSATPAPTTTSTDPVDGKLDLTWTNFVLGKQLKSSIYLRLGAGATLDTFGISNGIVTKGPGIGLDAKGDLLQAPTLTKAPVGSVYSTQNPANGDIVFGQSSLDLGVGCSIGTSIGTPPQPTTITEVIFSTDGVSLTGPVVNSSLSLSLP